LSSFAKTITDMVLDEVKAFIRSYARETEVMLRRRLKRLVITGIVTSILSALAISLLGSASLFLLIGSLEYLSTFMPRWEAWDIMGLIAGAAGAVLLVTLFIFLRKAFRSA
jgi:O-antigen ligase